MENVLLEQYVDGQQVFRIKIDGENLGEMIIKVSADTMTVYHTEVSPKMEGKGLAKELFAAMVAYARQQRLKVIPLCVFVLAQFKRHPELYADIWKKDD